MEESELENGPNETTPLLSPHAVDVAEDNGQVDEEEEAVLAAEVPPTTLFLIMSTAFVGVFLGAMDETIMATLIGPITSEFDSLYLLSWLATAYLISSAACLPITGRLTDIFGRGPGLALSNVLFATGNLICGFARDPYIMLVGRIIAGMGGAGMRSIANFLASDLVPLRRRGVVQAIANAFYGSGAMLGGVFGGLLNDLTTLGWRLAFLIQVPPIVVTSIAALVLVKVPPKQSEKSYLARIDFRGLFLACSFIVLLLLGLNSGGNMVPWVHPLPLVTLPLSFLLLIAFWVWERRALQPIIPVDLLLERTVLAASVTNFFSDMLLKASIFYVPLYLQVLGDSAVTAGRKILPSPVGDMLGALAAAYIMKWTGQYVRLGVPGMLALAVGTGFLTLQDALSPTWVTGVALFMIGIGYGVMLTVTQVACIAAVEHLQQAVIMSAIYFIRAIGSTVGITTASAVYQNVLTQRLTGRLGAGRDAVRIIQRLRDSLDELKHLPAADYAGVIESYMEAFHSVWQLLFCWAVLALLGIAALRQHQLHTTLSRC